MDVKISALPAAAAATTGQIFPVVIGGVTQKETGQQILTLVETGLNQMTLIGGGISLNANSSASFASGAFTVNDIGATHIGTGIVLNPDGTVIFSSGAFTIDDLGNLTSTGLANFDTGNFLVQSGGYLFASGGLTQLNGLIGNGTLSLTSNNIPGITTLTAENGLTINDGLATINQNGVASFANGNATIGPTGEVSLSSGNFEIDVAGNVDLHGGNLSNIGTITTGGNTGMTTSVLVLTALPSTFATLNFTNGILTSVT